MDKISNKLSFFIYADVNEKIMERKYQIQIQNNFIDIKYYIYYDIITIKQLQNKKTIKLQSKM